VKKTLIKIKNLIKEYRTKKDKIRALRGVSLDIYEGEILGLLGVNGAGKTTLSSIITTLHPPTSGEVHFGEKSIYDNVDFFRKKVGFCPQKANLINELTVKENLVFAGRYFDMTEKEIAKRVKELVKKYDLSKYLNSKPAVLSGGYRQRVLLARSLIHNPSLVILDEPTVGLDPHIRLQLWENIKELKRENVTVILTTHYLEEAEMLSDRICILDKGQIKLLDTPQNLKTKYKKKKLEDVFIQLMEEETA
jgi:ABC-2 type transport system ATP-binding protein